MKRFFRALGYYVFLAGFGLGATLTNLWVAVLVRCGRPPEPLLLRRRMRQILTGYLWCLRQFCGMRLRYEGWPEDWRERLRGAMLVANHPSLIDAPLFIARSERVICLYKASLEKTLLWPATAQHADYVSNDGGIEAVREAVDQLAAGNTLLLFPEGTRTRSHGLGEFVLGGALIAHRSKCPVQTFTIEISASLLTKEGSLLRPPKTPFDLVVRWGETFRCEPRETVRAFNTRLRAYFLSRIPDGSSAP